MRRAVEVSDLPQGVERVLTLAALHHRFRAELARDPVAAAASKGIVLDTAEAGLLRAARPEQLVAMAERMVIPRSPERRSFVKSVSASVVAMVTGKAFLLCSGCTGLDAYRRDAAIDGAGDGGAVDVGADQQWTALNGYTCYLYIPRLIADHRYASYGVMVALHGEDETCLASIQRWGTAADHHGFAIVAVSWTELAPTDETKRKLARDLGGIVQAFSARFAGVSQAKLSSRGASTPMAFRAAFVEPTNGTWQGAVFLGGVPDGDWVNDPATATASMQPKRPYLTYVAGEADPEYARAVACTTALRDQGVHVHFPRIAGSLSAAALDFSALYQAT